MVWPADLREGRRQTDPVCDDPVVGVDMEEDKDTDSDNYCDTNPTSSWAPTSAFTAPAATGLPLPTQPAALGMPLIPPPLPPAGLPAAAESGSAPQPWKCPSWGGQKCKRQESCEEGKRHSPSGGAGSTAPQGSAPALPLGWGGPWSCGDVGLAKAANAMQGLPPLGTDAAAGEVEGGEAKQVAGLAAVVPAALANPSAQSKVEGEERGRRAGSEAETAWRVAAKEEANLFLAESVLSSRLSEAFLSCLNAELCCLILQTQPLLSVSTCSGVCLSRYIVMLILAQPLLRQQCIWLCAAGTLSLLLSAPLSLSSSYTVCGAVVSTFMEAPGAKSGEGSQGVGGMPTGASPSEALLQAGNSEHLCPHYSL